MARHVDAQTLPVVLKINVESGDALSADGKLLDRVLFFECDTILLGEVGTLRFAVSEQSHAFEQLTGDCSCFAEDLFKAVHGEVAARQRVQINRNPHAHPHAHPTDGEN